MTAPQFLIIDDPATKADLARIQVMIDSLSRAMRESRDAFVGRAERGPQCPVMRLEDLRAAGAQGVFVRRRVPRAKKGRRS